MKVKCYSYVFACFFLCFAAFIKDGKAQRNLDNKVEADGVIEYHNRIPLAGAKLELYEGNELVRTLITNEKGEYHFSLDYNKEYTIVVSKLNLVTKKLYYNTIMPPEAKGAWWIGIPINLYEVCPGIDQSVFKEPVVKLEFNSKRKEYQVNESYEKVVKPRIMAFEDKNMNCLETNFIKLIKDADKLFAQKEYEEARELYETALDKRPWELYPEEQIAIIDEKLKHLGTSEKVYAQTIEQADKMYGLNEYFTAKTLYKRALLIKPGEDYPQDKINAIDKMMMEQAQLKQQELAKESKTNVLEQEARQAMAREDYALAKSKINAALQIEPDNQLLKSLLLQAEQQIKQQQQLSEKQKQEDARQAERNQEFNNLMQQGNMLMAQQKFDEASQAYTQAKMLQPENQTVAQRLEQLEQIKKQQLAEKEMASKQEIEKNFSSLLDQAGKMMDDDNFSAAINLYQQALKLKPGDAYTITRLNKAGKELEKQREDQQLVQVQYAQALQKGDQLTTDKQYDKAMLAYQEAQSLKPSEQAPVLKIQELKRLLEEQQQADMALKQEVDKNFNSLLDQAGKMMDDDNFTAAVNLYQQALKLKPGDAYTNSLLNKAQNILEKQRQDQQLVQAQYAKALQQGDQLKRDKQYDKAMLAYQEAQSLKPNEQVPVLKIQELKGLMEEQQLADNQQKLEAQYRALIAQADNLLKTGNNSLAKDKLQEALTLKPGDAYAQTRLASINQLEEAREQALIAEKDRDQKYDKALADAAILMQQKDYTKAKQAYNYAQGLKPDEPYPSDQLKQIDLILETEEDKKREEQLAQQNYTEQMQLANNLIAQERFEEAKVALNTALQHKPGDSMASKKIAEVQAKQQQLMAQQQQQRERETKYAQLITSAQSQKSNGNLQEARSLLVQAKSIMPGDNKAEDELAQIEQMIEVEKQELAAQREREQNFAKAIAEADKLFKEASYNDAKDLYAQAQQFKPDDDYAGKRIAQIEDILNKLAAQRNQSTVKVEKKLETSQPLQELKFKDDNEREIYLGELLKKYPPGITHEVYKNSKSTINRFVIVRNNKASEFREIRHYWGGVDYSYNDKPVTAQFFAQQTKKRPNEYYNKVDK